MIHTETYTVRWHDTDAAREVRPTALLALMQETSSLQFLRHGRSLDTIRDEDGAGFMVSRLSFDLLAPLHAFEELRIETFTCEGHGLTFPRGFRVYRGEALVARCHSTWALVRIADRTLVKVKDAPPLFENEPPVETHTPLRFLPPPDATFEKVGERRVVWSDLDYNMHMNNTKYADTVWDFLEDPAHWRVTGMSFAYHREAAFGSTLRLERAGGDGLWYFRAFAADDLCFEAMVRAQKR